MRTVHPFDPQSTANSLQLNMASAATVDPNAHLPRPSLSSASPDSRSPSSSPAQPNLSLLSSHQPSAHPPPSSSQHPLPSAASASNLPAPDPNTSLQSLLTSPKNPQVPHNGQLPPWNASTMVLSQPGPPPGSNHAAVPPTVASGKRKLDDADSDDPHNKIRRVVRDHVKPDSHARPMTTVICLHAAVAQKSYGSEKRFLCPPPVVHIEGPVWHMRQQQLSMAVVSEDGHRSFEQKAPLDNNMTASFKFLHVTGTAKAKSFQLSLDIAEPPAPSLAPEGSDTPKGRTWASFDSAPVTIISKPSKKTAKTRNITSCILAGGPVSLFNRINSQTVRTKYMTIDHAQLCASNVSWSAFNVNVVRRPTDAPNLGGPQPVTYGSEVILSDTHSGISTAPLVIKKVDKGRIINDDGGPVSQMQKIALQRVNADGTRHYLSAAGPVSQPGVVPPPAPGMNQQAGTHALLFSSPRVRDELKDGVRVITDEVDDYLCWTIVGISKFQYTFFDAFGQNSNIPDTPITPFPTLFTAPTYRPPNNTLDLTVSNFFYEDPKTRTQTPLDVYLGNLGPLRQRVYQATPPGPLTNISPFVHSLTGPSSSPMDAGPSGDMPGPPRFMATGPLHTIVVVEMPPLQDIIKALEEDEKPQSSSDGVKGGPPPSATAESASSSSPTSAGPERTAANGASSSVSGRSLPLLFIRACDGVGYHSGRTITVENIFSSMDINSLTSGAPSSQLEQHAGWIAAAQAAAAADGGINNHGWTLRVL